MRKTNLQILILALPILAFILTGSNYPTLKVNSYVENTCASDQGEPQEKGVNTVVIDAGHGGKDPGCSGKSIHEKKVALSIAKKLAEKIRTNYPNVKVILTRDKDVFIPLYERAAIANRNNADLFISIHCNAMPPNNESTKGTETYVMGLHTAKHNLAVAKRENASILLEADYEKNYDYDPNSPEGHIMLSMYQNAFLEQSILIADKVEMQFKTKDSRKSRGVKQAGFVVLKETTMPSILIETGFLTNKNDEAYLFTAEGQDETAQSIFEAFASYKKEVEGELDLPLPPSIAEVRQHEAAQSHSQPQVNFNSKKSISEMTPKGGSATPKPKVVLHKPSAYQTKAKGGKPAPYPIAVKKTNKKHTLTKKSPQPNSYSKTPTKAKSTTAPSHLPIISPIEKPGSNEVSPIRFKVQMAVTSNLVSTDTAPWNNHRYMIEIIQKGNVYTYQARNFGNYYQAQKAKNNLRKGGFPDAFLVAYKNGERIPINEAKRILGLL